MPRLPPAASLLFPALFPALFLAASLFSCHSPSDARDAAPTAPADPVTEFHNEDPLPASPAASAGNAIAPVGPTPRASKLIRKAALEHKLAAGTASPADLRLLAALCKDLDDDDCTARVREAQPRPAP
jgi:hypothetical protein